MTGTRRAFGNPPSHISLSGDWTTATLAEREAEIEQIDWPTGGGLIVDTSTVTRLDTAGAWLLNVLAAKLRDSGVDMRFDGLSKQQRNVMDLVASHRDSSGVEAPPDREGLLTRLGRRCCAHLVELWRLLAFVGETSLCLGRLALTPWKIRWRTCAAQVQATGFDALPIVGLLAFLIGVVIAYQGGIQLKIYGANIFIVELVSITAVRELGPLLAAIVVAGRTGSAFAAQLASMNAADEIDSIRVMGLDPIELLVVPRLLGLTLALPLLSVFSDIMTVFGGMLMSLTLLDVSLRDFAVRLPQAVSMNSFALGIAKTPVFAIILACVGCYQGLSASKSAQSVGANTTRSVVQGIFLVIVADAAFSVLFSALGI